MIKITGSKKMKKGKKDRKVCIKYTAKKSIHQST